MLFKTKFDQFINKELTDYHLFHNVFEITCKLRIENVHIMTLGTCLSTSNAILKHRTQFLSNLVKKKQKRIFVCFICNQLSPMQHL